MMTKWNQYLFPNWPMCFRHYNLPHRNDFNIHVLRNQYSDWISSSLVKNKCLIQQMNNPLKKPINGQRYHSFHLPNIDFFKYMLTSFPHRRSHWCLKHIKAFGNQPVNKNFFAAIDLLFHHPDRWGGVLLLVPLGNTDVHFSIWSEPSTISLTTTMWLSAFWV